MAGKKGKVPPQFLKHMKGKGEPDEDDVKATKKKGKR